MSHNSCSLYRLLSWHSTLPQPPCLLHLPHPHRLRRNLLPHHRRFLHRRHLPPYRTRYSYGLVPLWNTYRTSIWPLHWRYYCYVSVLAGDFLPSDSAGRRCAHRRLLLTPGNYSSQEVQRPNQTAIEGKSQSTLGDDESLSRRAIVQISEPNNGSTRKLKSGMEHVLSPNTHPLYPQSALQSHHPHPIRALLPRSRLRLHSRHILWWTVRGLYHHLLGIQTRRSRPRRSSTFCFALHGNRNSDLYVDLRLVDRETLWRGRTACYHDVPAGSSAVILFPESEYVLS